MREADAPDFGSFSLLNRTADARVRAAAFDWLSGQVARHGDVLPRPLLTEGFELDGRRVPLLGPQGIFKPAVMELPLSIATIPTGPYDDAIDADGTLRYRYRGTDPTHRDNVGLREAMRERLPLVYFHRVVPSKYVAAWPVYIVADDPARLTFGVQVDDADHIGLGPDQGWMVTQEDATERRRYMTSLTRRRLHQRTFRERVLLAYRRECAFCHFRHVELLEAAHITPDVDPLGEPVVSNGMALCRLHHGAFDRHFVAVRPDLRLEVRPDLLKEKDGPTLLHGIQALQGQRIQKPRRAEDQPDPERLRDRYQVFLAEAERLAS